MPRAGGIFSLIASYFATPGQTIRTEQHNPVLEDIAQALTGSVARDGSSPMLGNLPMNGRKITNLGAATLASDVPRFDQVLPSSPYLNAVSGLTLAANQIPYATGAATAAITPLTVFGRSLIDDADAAAGGVLLGLIEALGSGYIGVLTGGVLGSHYSEIFAFIVLIVILTLRPSGLLGERVADRA